MTDSTRKNKCRIAVDAMGGDYAPESIIAGSLQALEENRDIELLLVGREEEIKKYYPGGKERCEIIPAAEVIGMNESPAQAIKQKKDSSLVLGAKLVRQGDADSFISAGNTGAMLAASTLLTGRIRGVGRPTIGAPMPTMSGGVCFLFDVGASVDCKPQHLLEYALMSSIFAEEIYGLKNPSVGILNVGEEEKKGNELSQAAYKLLSEANINFAGNVEGGDILKGKVDIVICDGFIGNIILKFAESVLGLIKNKFKRAAEESFMNKLKIGAARGVMKSAFSDMDYQNQGGVPLLGIKGINIVGHGSSSPLAIKNMIFRAEEMFRRDLLNKFEKVLEDNMGVNKV